MFMSEMYVLSIYILQSFYSIAINNGKVHGRFSGGGNPVNLESKDLFNDGEVHNIAVKKTDRRYVDFPILYTDKE